MPASHRITFTAILLFSTVLFTTFATAQTVIFNHSVINAPGSGAPVEHADLNNDGREDFIGALTGYMVVTLSNGDGTYAAPVQYATGDGASPYRFTIADVNNDGWADILANAGGNKIYEFVNNGDGTFHLQSTFLTTGKAGAMATGDLNHDGKPDLAFVMENDSTSPPTFTLEIWRGNGDNGFDPLSSTPGIAAIGFAFVGNFDGDGNADVMLEDHDYGSTVELLYGDGTGHFSAHQTIFDNPYFEPYDLNGNGVQDLVGVSFDFSTNGSTWYKQIHALVMNGRNTPATKDIPLQRCATGPPTVGDFNGDGIPDIAVIEHSDCQGATPDFVSVLLGNSDGTYQPEQDIYQSSGGLAGPVVIRGNHDTKADLVVQEQASGGSGGPPSHVFLNETSGSFPSCPAPDAFTGISACSPGSTASGSPVHFGIGAAGQTLMRKVEVWVDGTKMGQQLVKNFSRYGYFDQDLALSNGTHTVDIFAAGYDNLLQHKSFQVTVGSSGGGSCPVPSTPGVNICSPANGSTVTSPIHILASGKNTGTTAGMDVWLDGSKVGWYSGTQTVDIQDYVAPGSHRLDIYARGTNGELQEATSYFTVPSSTNCPAPSSSGGVNMCSPVNGSTISSPLHVIATGGSAVDTIEVWIDGNKIAQEVGAKGTITFDLQFPLSAGSHRVHLNAKSSGVLTDGVTAYFTVQ